MGFNLIESMPWEFSICIRYNNDETYITKYNTGWVTYAQLILLLLLNVNFW